MPDHAFVTLSNTSSASDPVTHSHTPGSRASVAIVSLIMPDTSQRTGSSPTIGGVPAIQADTVRYGLEQNVEIWYQCKNFDAGNAFEVSIGNTKLLPCFVEVVTANAGAGYNSYLAHSTGLAYADGTADGLTLDLTAPTSGTFVYSMLGCGEASTASIAENSTTPVKTATNIVDRGAYCSWGCYGVATTAGVSRFNWTWSNDDGCAVAVAFAATSQPYAVSPKLIRGQVMSGGSVFQTSSIQRSEFCCNQNRYKNRED